MDAAQSYVRILDKQLINTYGKKKDTLKIIIEFKSEHLPHLIGLDKLDDIKTYIYDQREKTDILNAILTNEIKYEEIQKSELLHKPSSTNDHGKYTTYDRMMYFSLMIEILMRDKHDLFDFIDVRYTSIKADFIIKYNLPKSNDFMYLFIKKDAHNIGSYIPISFFPSENPNYFRGKKCWKLLLSQLYNDSKTEYEVYRSSNFKD